MSVHSDDTDVLLFIPPDFFLVPSDSEEGSVAFGSKPSEQIIVSDLISQVNDLEGRICLIESKSTFGCGEMYKSNENLKVKRFGSADTLNTCCKSSFNSRSLQTTPLKNCTVPSPCKNWRTGLSSSPESRNKKKFDSHQNMLTTSEYVNQKERDDQLLKEINNFFGKRENTGKIQDTIEGDIEKPLLETKEIGSLNLSTAVFNLTKVNDLLRQLEETQAEIEQKLIVKGNYEENFISNVLEKKAPIRCEPSEMSDKESYLEINSPRRVLDFNSASPRKRERTSDSKQDELKSEIVNNSLDSDLNCAKSKGGTEEADEINTKENANSKLSTELTDLLSLCQLWGNNKKTEDAKFQGDLKMLKQKYQEEQFRRRHCEDLIQKLQLRLLEEQQKVAVAVRVDREKDEAISKMTEGWNKLVCHWRESENQRKAFEAKLESEREKFQDEVSVACQTVKRYETELSKALDLAHGYKEKCEISEKEKKKFISDATKEIDALKNELRNLKEKLQREKSHVEKLEKSIGSKDENLNQAKRKLCEMQSQSREQKKIVKDLQTELEAARVEKEKCIDKMRDEKIKISNLEQNLKVLSQANEELKRREKILKENVRATTEQVEKIKLELKEFYQGQVEKIVQEKLKEFQEQLSVAEKRLQNEMEERERTVAEMAVKQVQQIVEKHAVEVNILEEKHKEEIELWKIKVVRAEEKVAEMEKKLDDYSSRKSEIAQKLQRVMEAQWQEAMKIITASSPQHQRSPSSGCGMNPEKELKREKTFTMTSFGLGEGSPNKSGFNVEVEPSSPSSLSEPPFCQDGRNTFRDRLKSLPENTYRIDETPQKMESESVDSLKKYIQMLLDRPPGLPVDDGFEKSSGDSTLFNISEACDILRWQQVLVGENGSRDR